VGLIDEVPKQNNDATHRKCYRLAAFVESVATQNVLCVHRLCR